jgi:hypothetical protein
MRRRRRGRRFVGGARSPSLVAVSGVGCTAGLARRQSVCCAPFVPTVPVGGARARLTRPVLFVRGRAGLSGEAGRPPSVTAIRSVKSTRRLALATWTALPSPTSRVAAARHELSLTVKDNSYRSGRPPGWAELPVVCADKSAHGDLARANATTDPECKAHRWTPRRAVPPPKAGGRPRLTVRRARGRTARVSSAAQQHAERDRGNEQGAASALPPRQPSRAANPPHRHHRRRTNATAPTATARPSRASRPR